MIESKFHYVHTASNALFWIFLLQGISFVLLGILVLLYPEILFVLMSALFVWIGLTTFLMAWRIRKFKKDFIDFTRLP